MTDRIDSGSLVRDNDSTYYKNFLQQIDEDELINFKEEILKGTFLPDIRFSYESSAGFLTRMNLLNRLFSTEEIEDWFKKSCWKHFSELPQNERWYPMQKDYFETILGSQELSKTRNGCSENLIKSIKKAYFTFKEDIGYDPICLKLLKEAIENVQTLEEVMAFFKQKYKNTKSFLRFLEDMIDQEISSQEFEHYFSRMLEKLKNELGCGENHFFPVTLIENYIFGKRMNLRPGSYQSSAIQPVRLLRSFYRVIFPTVCKTLHKKNLRESIYEFCRFSPEERNYWESVYESSKNKEPLMLKGRVKGNSRLEALELNQDEVKQVNKSLDRVVQEYKSLRKVPSLSELRNRIQEESRLPESFFHEVRYNNPFKKQNLNEILAQKIEEIKKHLYETQQQEEFLFERDIWRVYRKTGNGYFYHTLDFTPVKGKKLREDLKVVALEDIRISQGKDRFADRMPVIISLTAFLEEYYKIESFMDIDRLQIMAMFHHYRIREDKSPQTISKYKIHFSFAFEILQSQKEEYENLKNLPSLIRGPKNSYSIKTADIPDYIVDEIFNYLQELPEQTALLLELFFQSGWRYRELQELTPGSFIEDTQEPRFVKMIGQISKVKQSHRSNGLGEYISCLITRDLYERIMNFVSRTQKEREIYQISTLFYTISGGRAKSYSHKLFNKNVNEMIKKHNIQDAQENPWHFSSRQIRTTVATDLFNSGASITSVQKQLNHSSPDITAAYYVRPDRRQTAGINSDYYNRYINQDSSEMIKLKPEVEMDLYETETEEFFLTGFGECSRPSGPCTKPLLKHCSGCPKLCFSKESLPHWKKLFENTQKTLKLYEDYCLRAGITEEEMSTFNEYLSLKQLSFNYELLIKKAGENDSE